jgi:predicted neutral ceramidase superfamily lipid hydrolase
MLHWSEEVVVVMVLVAFVTPSDVAVVVAVAFCPKTKTWLLFGVVEIKAANTISSSQLVLERSISTRIDECALRTFLPHGA